MIKRVIFDIDNTLIQWKEEYNNEVKKAFQDFNLTCSAEECKLVLDALDEYENVYYKFNIDLMYSYLNEYTKKEYSKDLLCRIIERWGECVPDSIDSKIIDLLEYLKIKYELVILTDWYKKPQLNRLKKLGIDTYFSEIYTAENVNRKPFKEAFKTAIGSYKPEECIMIGDSLQRDIKGAKNVGIKTIYYNIDNKKQDIATYTVSKLEEIKSIL